MRIEPISPDVFKVSIALTRANGKSHIAFHAYGNKMGALSAGFQAIEENEQQENISA